MAAQMIVKWIGGPYDGECIEVEDKTRWITVAVLPEFNAKLYPTDLPEPIDVQTIRVPILKYWDDFYAVYPKENK